MRLVLDARTATDHFPGIGRYTANLARAMAPLLGKNERLILLRDPIQPSPWDLTALAGERVQVVDVSLSPFSLRQQWVVPCLLRRLGGHIYHSPYYLMPYRPGVPTVVTVYDLIPLLHPQYASVQARLLFRWTTALVLQTAAHVIAVSQATRHDLLAVYRLPPERITAISLAADPAFRPRLPAEVEARRRKYGLPERYVLYLGSNKPHKNLVRLVEAWARLQPQPFSLVIAGVWDSRYPEARQRAKTLALGEAIRFLGSVVEEDMPSLYSGATLFVFPSEYEGFGLPVLEAMACGASVACSNTSSLPEVGGDAVLYFDPADVEAIAETLRRALADPDLRAELRERGLARAAQFSWERTARETIHLYRETLK